MRRGTSRPGTHQRSVAGRRDAPPSDAAPGEPRARESASETADRRTGSRAGKGLPGVVKADAKTPSSDFAIATETPSQTSDPLLYMLPTNWELIVICMGSVLATMVLVSRSVPTPSSWALLAISFGICLAGTRLYQVEQRLGFTDWKRYVLMVVAIGVPLAVFGFVCALWTERVPALGWETTASCFVILSLMATVLLEGRLTSIIVATIALWGGAWIIAGTPTSLLLLASGALIGLFLAIRRSQDVAAEIERRVEREREQRRAEELLNEYEQTGQGWFWETDRRNLLTYVSAHICALLGKSSEELLGRPLSALFLLQGHESENERTLVFHLSTRSSFRDLSVRAATGVGDERWWSISGRPVMDQFNNFMGFRGSGTDLTETRKSQQHATRLARYDSLTKLANRFHMSEWLEKILSAPRIESRACAVFLLDLDRFKQVNDTMGHPAGDALLKQVADRLRSTVGKHGRVGRLGGDEFQVILPGRHVTEGLANLARRIIENLSQPYSIDGSRVVIGASIGISTCPENGTSSEEIIRNADLALYAAKGGGRGRHHFYDDDLHSDAKERQQMEEDLRDAIANGSLELVYQPQVRTTTEMITGFEALLRWNHPRHGYISPAKFVPIAEDTGLVAPIGEWALRTACMELARWPDTVRCAVNVSPLQFANPSLPAIVTSAIASAGIAPSRLELEITESVFLGEDKSTEGMFSALKAIGVRLALDDFGTGYSSLGYLKKAPFDKIKIDQSFVRGATQKGSRNGAIISSIVSLAEALGMETTAEGVETLDELDLVRMLGCSHVQGYIYEKPLSVQGVEERLAEGLEAVARGPRSARAPRQTMLRKVVLEHGSHVYHGTIRNISQTGAMIEGLWNVPVGTQFGVHLAADHVMIASTRWSREDRMGVEFAQALELDGNGAVVFSAPGRRDENDVRTLRKAG
ncbi:EAL domain-containing protein [Novosphingobium sp. 1949]|uniref:EAL domain-containing protein n=1 Tax=Novosphingobium organovorum TaxID=2930092 RepID=A0ABT0BAF7_9SPHN|nr:EAL domain-containing protein [Novosphingobium organovorum]MCJ2182047.1 EAL domain-containing protein [Novosphingobium organovorum]